MLKQPAKIASAVRASTTLAIDSLAKKMQADGLDVIGFGTGEPDFPTPANISEAGKNAIDSNKTKYTPASGIPALKKAICDRIFKECGLKYEPSNVCVSNGAKQVVYNALMCLCDPGDEVIILAPYWVSYYEMVKQAGGIPIEITATESNGFKVTAEQIRSAITPKTKALMLNNPSNPTGMLYSKAQLQSIADVCMEAGIFVIADEIYSKLVYDNNEFVSFASLGEDVKDRTILITGVSKSYAMTGWRIGYSLANEELTKIMSNYQSHATSGPCTISQWAAIEALNGPQDTIEVMRQEFEKRRNYIFERMNAIDGVSCIMPEGAFYVMMNIEKLIGKTMYGTKINNDDDFASLFLTKALVAIVPCSGFGMPNYLRWSYATSMDNIKKGMDRLEDFLKNA